MKVASFLSPRTLENRWVPARERVFMQWFALTWVLARAEGASVRSKCSRMFRSPVGEDGKDYSNLPLFRGFVLQLRARDIKAPTQGFHVRIKRARQRWWISSKTSIGECIPGDIPLLYYPSVACLWFAHPAMRWADEIVLCSSGVLKHICPPMSTRFGLMVATAVDHNNFLYQQSQGIVRATYSLRAPCVALLREEGLSTVICKDWASPREISCLGSIPPLDAKLSPLDSWRKEAFTDGLEGW